MKINIS